MSLLPSLIASYDPFTPTYYSGQLKRHYDKKTCLSLTKGVIGSEILKIT